MVLKNNNSFYEKFKNKIGIKEFLKFICGFILLPFTTCIRFFQALYSLKFIFKDSNFTNYNRFSPNRGINSTFYYVEALMLEKYGRHGYSYELSLGKKMSEFFYFTYPSYWLYRHLGGALTEFLFMLILILNILCLYLWDIFSISHECLFLVLLIGLFSTTFYYLTFESQNYNVVGWAFFPVFLLSLISGNWLLTTILLLIISFCSFTATSIGIGICIIFAFIYLDFLVFMTVLPASINNLSKIRLWSNEGQEHLNKILNFVGFTNKGKGKRKLAFGFDSLYFLFVQLTYTIFFAFFVDLTADYSFDIFIILIISLIMHVVNTRFARFADPQSLNIFFFISSTIGVISNFSIQLLIVYLFSINIPPLLLGFAGEKIDNILFMVPKREAYNIQPLLEEFDNLLKSVPANSRIIELHKYDENDYGSLFKGFRTVHEIILYSANLKSINLIPDFYAIQDSWSINFPLSKVLKPDPENAINATKTLGSPYILLNVDNNSHSHSEWEKVGFKELYRVEWRDLKKYFGNSYILADENKSFRLLKYSSRNLMNLSIYHGCELLERRSNCMKLRIINNDGVATIKYLFDGGWRIQNEIKNGNLKKKEGEWPWIEVHAKQGSEITLIYS